MVRQRHWTGYYFRQALGFQFGRQAGFPYFLVVPNNPFLITSGFGRWAQTKVEWSANVGRVWFRGLPFCADAKDVVSVEQFQRWRAEHRRDACCYVGMPSA